MKCKNYEGNTNYENELCQPVHVWIWAKLQREKWRALSDWMKRSKGRSSEWILGSVGILLSLTVQGKLFFGGDEEF